MRLVALHVYRWKPEDAKLLCSEMNLSELWFYQRGIAKDLINFNSRTIAGRIPKGSKASITLENDVGKCHCFVSLDGIAATAMTDNEYDERAAATLLNKLIMEFREAFQPSGFFDREINEDTLVTFPRLAAILQEWQNPMEADKLLRIERELQEVQDIVHKNLEDLLRRGEAMDELMVKSKDLSTASHDFYKKAKKANSRCCNIN
eukprot:Macronucleus_3568.p1 GENE.Macronucleus_3568~~Macronucleus_3568.p1  ORF type:complete len:205 (+),score=59.37 Macronucleus_3568:1-615(+)